MNKRVLQFIRLIRESHKEMVNIYTKGSCLDFFFILRNVFPSARAYYNSNHIITRIDGRYYDITGQVEPDRHLPLVRIYDKKGLIRAVREMMRAEFEIIK